MRLSLPQEPHHSKNRSGVKHPSCGAFFVGFTLLMIMLTTAVWSLTTASAQSPSNSTSTKAGPGGSETGVGSSGKDLFNQHCASCHFAETAAQKIGPGLKGLYTRLTFSDGKKVTDINVTRWIEAGGKNMPGFKEAIKPEQIRALISYLKTL
jgi:mono/diheme cytochrome c family protein